MSDDLIVPKSILLVDVEEKLELARRFYRRAENRRKKHPGEAVISTCKVCGKGSYERKTLYKINNELYCQDDRPPRDDPPKP